VIYIVKGLWIISQKLDRRYIIVYDYWQRICIERRAPICQIG